MHFTVFRKVLGHFVVLSFFFCNFAVKYIEGRNQPKKYI